MYECRECRYIFCNLLKNYIFNNQVLYYNLLKFQIYKRIFF